MHEFNELSLWLFLWEHNALSSCSLLTAVSDQTMALLKWTNKVTFIRFLFQKCFKINISRVSVSGDKLSQSHYFTCFPLFLQFQIQYPTVIHKSTQINTSGGSCIWVAAFSCLANQLWKPITPSIASVVYLIKSFQTHSFLKAVIIPKAMTLSFRCDRSFSHEAFPHWVYYVLVSASSGQVENLENLLKCRRERQLRL